MGIKDKQAAGRAARTKENENVSAMSRNFIKDKAMAAA